MLKPMLPTNTLTRYKETFKKFVFKWIVKSCGVGLKQGITKVIPNNIHGNNRLDTLVSSHFGRGAVAGGKGIRPTLVDTNEAMDTST